MTTEENMSRTLDTIHDEAAKLLKFEMAKEVRSGLNEIIALARYKFDVRGNKRRAGESNDDK